MARLTVGTTPVRLDVIGTDNIAGTSGLYRCDTADLFLGRDQAEATAANGYLVPAGQAYSEDILGRDQLWASAPTTATVYVLRAGV